MKPGGFRQVWKGAYGEAYRKAQRETVEGGRRRGVPRAAVLRIMDQRVLFNSAVRCSGNVLLLQGKKYSPPFKISAIGPVEGMRKALDDSEEVSIYKQYVSAFGLGWQVDEKTKLHFDATDALQQPLQYAKALENDKNGDSQEGK